MIRGRVAAAVEPRRVVVELTSAQFAALDGVVELSGASGALRFPAFTGL
jgi:hypothetical protein